MTVARIRAGWAAFLAALLLAACDRPPAPLGHDAYVWQRRWQPPLAAALANSSDLMGRWRILAAEVDARGRFHPMAVDFAAIAASGRPAIPVVRIEAPLDSVAPADLIVRIGALQRRWLAASTAVAGLEIDHDCPTRQLDSYRDFLLALRPALVKGQLLSITLLPDWLQARDSLGKLLSTVDDAVLQLHSLRNPAGELFDPASARAWTMELAGLAPNPFHIALPTYGSRLYTDERGQIAGIESEVPVGQVAGRSGKESFASPGAVAAFLRRIEREPPPKLAGVVWFRLPVDGDSRAWSLSTWRAVITGKALPVQLVTELLPAGGNRPLVLRNAGEMDADLPAVLVVEAPCTGSASQGSYVLERQGPDSVFLRSDKGLLKAGSRLTVGSVRCPGVEGKIHVQP